MPWPRPSRRLCDEPSRYPRAPKPNADLPRFPLDREARGRSGHAQQAPASPKSTAGTPMQSLANPTYGLRPPSRFSAVRRASCRESCGVDPRRWPRGPSPHRRGSHPWTLGPTGPTTQFEQAQRHLWDPVARPLAPLAAEQRGRGQAQGAGRVEDEMHLVRNELDDAQRIVRQGAVAGMHRAGDPDLACRLGAPDVGLLTGADRGARPLTRCRRSPRPVSTGFDRGRDRGACPRGRPGRRTRPRRRLSRTPPRGARRAALARR